MGLFKSIKKLGGRVISRAKDIGGQVVKSAKNIAKEAALGTIGSIPIIGGAAETLLRGGSLKDAGIELAKGVPLVGTGISIAQSIKEGTALKDAAKAALKTIPGARTAIKTYETAEKINKAAGNPVKINF